MTRTAAFFTVAFAVLLLIPSFRFGPSAASLQ
jgi:hypothetical protein